MPFSMRRELHSRIATWLESHSATEQMYPSIAFHHEHGKTKNIKKITHKKKKKKK